MPSVADSASTPAYRRHRPEQTALYAIVAEHYPSFIGCRHEHLVAFSCKRRGFCPSCGARRMLESAAHLVDHVFPEVPVRQFVLTFPAGFTVSSGAKTGAVTLIQRFGSALNLNPHLHMLFLDGDLFAATSGGLPVEMAPKKNPGPVATDD